MTNRALIFGKYDSSNLFQRFFLSFIVISLFIVIVIGTAPLGRNNTVTVWLFEWWIPLNSVLSHVTFVDDILVVPLFIGYLIFYAPCRLPISLSNVVYRPAIVHVYLEYFGFKSRRHSRRPPYTLLSIVCVFLMHERKAEKSVWNEWAASHSLPKSAAEWGMFGEWENKTSAVRWVQRWTCAACGRSAVGIGGWTVIEHIAFVIRPMAGLAHREAAWGPNHCEYANAVWILAHRHPCTDVHICAGPLYGLRSWVLGAERVYVHRARHRGADTMWYRGWPVWRDVLSDDDIEPLLRQEIFVKMPFGRDAFCGLRVCASAVDNRGLVRVQRAHLMKNPRSKPDQRVSKRIVPWFLFLICPLGSPIHTCIYLFVRLPGCEPEFLSIQSIFFFVFFIVCFIWFN